MIGRLRGQLIEKNPPQVLIDCAGVGYEVDVPMSTFYQLPEIGTTVQLLTHFVVREDAQLLYGFFTEQERQTFRQLIKVSGVGPKLALTILSGMSVDELLQSVSEQNVDRMIKVPGIGKKTAERLLLELKDKLKIEVNLTAIATNPAQDDILQALLSLGYNAKEAAAGLKNLPENVSVSDGIKLALKTLS